MPLRRAVFLDRDGVINRAPVRDGRPYPPDRLEDLEILPGVPAALGRLHDAEAAYRHALEIRADYAPAHYNLGLALKLQAGIASASACSQVVSAGHCRSRLSCAISTMSTPERRSTTRSR